MGLVPALATPAGTGRALTSGQLGWGHRARPRVVSLGTRWTVSGGEAAGKVLQSQGRNEQSQKNESLPSPCSLGTGWQSGQSDVHSVCGGKVCVCVAGGLGGGGELGGVGLRRAMNDHAKFSAFSLRWWELWAALNGI